MQDDKKFFDVNRQPFGPQPTSKPVIVGHRPTMPDPMVKEGVIKPQLTDLSTPQETTPSLTPSVTPPATTGVETAFIPADTPPEPSADFTNSAGGEKLQVPAGQPVYSHKPRLWVWVVAVLVILAAAYAAVDAKTDILPFHIFSHAKNNSSASQAGNSSSSSGQPIILNQSNLPSGFSQYQPTGTSITFAYPTAWGAPTTTTDPGFSQRGKDKQSDGTYAYIVNFATNKDVQVAITSSKYLPAPRTALYYDFLQWCTGTNDGKFYKEILHFSTTSGIDTPTTRTCDQGPLADASKLNNAVIVQLQTKDASGAVLGDIYTANLSDTSLPVLRVKDAKMTNGDNIKKLLGTISSSSTSQ